MRCRNCDYELWNLAPGRCPECSTLWQFEDFRFRPSAAQFLCPHCEHAYGGNDAAGLPSPRQFTCVSCKNEISLAQMRALPAPGINRDEAMEDQHPWIERARIGRWRAFRQTTRASIVTPTALGAALPLNLSLTGPLIYSAICNSTALTGCVIAPIAVLVIIDAGVSNPTAIGFWSTLSPMLLAGLAFAIGFQLLILAWGRCTHWLLRMSGETARGWRHTSAALLFCSAPMMASAIPCCGVYVAALTSIWMIVAAIPAVVGAQKVSAGRAAFAVLLPSLGLLALIGATLVWGVATVISLSNPPPAPGGGSTPVQGNAAVDESPDSDPQLLPAP